MFIQPKDSEGNKSLAEVKHGTEKLQLNVEPSRLVVEQPPQAAGEVGKQADDEKQTQQDVSGQLWVSSLQVLLLLPG